MRRVHLYSLFFRLAVGFLHPESWWRGLENLCACRLIIIKHSGVALYTAKWCMVEHTILASTLWLHVFIHFLSSLLLKQSQMQLYEQKVTLIMKTKGHIDVLRQRPQRPRSSGSHMPVQASEGRQTLGQAWPSLSICTQLQLVVDIFFRSLTVWLHCYCTKARWIAVYLTLCTFSIS